MHCTDRSDTAWGSCWQVFPHRQFVLFQPVRYIAPFAIGRQCRTNQRLRQREFLSQVQTRPPQCRLLPERNQEVCMKNSLKSRQSLFALHCDSLPDSPTEIPEQRVRQKLGRYALDCDHSSGSQPLALVSEDPPTKPLARHQNTWKTPKM